MGNSLREARDKGKLKEFIAEHKDDAPGDAKAFDRTLSAMAGKPAEKKSK
ncbi:MAG: hypothetical protein AB7P20_28230 [Rhizobiaceae bacterium]